MTDPCDANRDRIADRVLGQLNRGESALLDDHMKGCFQCRDYAEALVRDREELLRLGESVASDMDARRAKVLEALYHENTRQRRSWSGITHSRMTKIAAAVILLAAVALSTTIFDNVFPPAYSLERSIQASHGVLSMRTRSYWQSHDEPIEGWIEFDGAGAIRNVRLHMPAWTDPNDGEKTIVWKNETGHIWIKKKKLYVVTQDRSIVEVIQTAIQGLDPKMALLYLRELESDGHLKLEISTPESKVGPMIVTAVFLPARAAERQPSTPAEDEMRRIMNYFKGSEEEITRFVLTVEQTTALVSSIQFYEKDAQEEERCVGRLEFHDYNQELSAGLFVLDDDIPADAVKLDQTADDIGLAQGDRTREEVGAEVIRQFLRALIDRDYAKAGRLWGGIPAERMKKTYGSTRFLRILSVGKPVPHPSTRGLHVPCSVEIEEKGQVTEWRPKHSYVREVEGRPGRWQIIGGFRGF